MDYLPVIAVAPVKLSSSCNGLLASNCHCSCQSLPADYLAVIAITNVRILQWATCQLTPLLWPESCTGLLGSNPLCKKQSVEWDKNYWKCQDIEFIGSHCHCRNNSNFKPIQSHKEWLPIHSDRSPCCSKWKAENIKCRVVDVQWQFLFLTYSYSQRHCLIAYSL